MMSDYKFVALRLMFADFLEKLGDGGTSATEWQSLVVTHYQDEFLEELRRCTVRLMQDQLPYRANTEPAREALRCWAIALRSSCSPDELGSPNDEVRVTVTQAEAVVLDSLLRRFSESNRFVIEHPAERQSLWNLACVLERDENRPEWPSLEDAYKELGASE